METRTLKISYPNCRACFLEDQESQRKWEEDVRGAMTTQDQRPFMDLMDQTMDGQERKNLLDLRRNQQGTGNQPRVQNSEAKAKRKRYD